MKKLRVAIIGYGGMGAYHGRNLIALEYYEVSGIYDIDETRYEAAKNDGIKNYPAFHSKEEVAEDKNTDAVLIATPNDFHLPYVKYFAKAKKHIICEKPVGLFSAEYAEMLEVCKENGVKFVVHQNRRWDSDFLTVKRMYDTGSIGRIRRYESRVQGGNGIPGDWRKFKEKGGGMMLDWGVHLIDQFVYMLPELPESVYCKYSYEQGFEVEDGFRLILNYKDNTTVEIIVDTDCFIRPPRWCVYGENGTAVVRDWELNGEIIKPIYSADYKIAGIKAGNGFTKTMAYRTAESVEKCELDKVNGDRKAFYREFYDVVVNGKECMIKPEQVMNVMKIMEAAYKSAHENKVIKI